MYVVILLMNIPPIMLQKYFGCGSWILISCDVSGVDV
jgi:hypothetical protein